MNDGLSKEDATAAVLKKDPPAKSVKVFDKRGTNTRKTHLLVDHQIALDQPLVAGAQQPLITTAMHSLSAKLDDAEIKAALYYCMNPWIHFSQADDPWFIQGHGHPVSRYKLPGIVAAIALDVKNRVKQALKRSNVCLAVDGWTSWRHMKTFNFELLWNGPAVFWKAVPSVFGKSLEVMFEFLSVEVEDQLKVTRLAPIEL